MKWLPKWKRKYLKAAEWRREQEYKSQLGWQDWYAWKPVTVNRREPPFYYDSERRVWLEKVQRKWYQAHEYDTWHWIYTQDKPKDTREGGE